jgi:Helix-turn-helix domain/AraC-like ligand binding domain
VFRSFVFTLLREPTCVKSARMAIYFLFYAYLCLIYAHNCVFSAHASFESNANKSRKPALSGTSQLQPTWLRTGSRRDGNAHRPKSQGVFLELTGLPAMNWSSPLGPISATVHTANPSLAVDWHTHWQAALCLVDNGTLAAEHAGRRFSSEPGTLLLFVPGETRAFRNQENASARLLVLSFRITSAASNEFRPLLELAPDERVIKVSAGQQRTFCDFFFKIAFEQDISASPSLGNSAAASAWLALTLTSVMRWTLAFRQATRLPEVPEEVNRPCFDLWQKIHRHALQTKAAEPMLVSQNPMHDSLRHRFRKTFGVSPRRLLIRLRMERAKQLLRASNLSIKEIAQELGYSRQHEFARAFRNYFGVSPSQSRGQGKNIPIAALASIKTGAAMPTELRLR